MFEEKKESNIGILGLVLFVVGIYMFLFSFIKNRSTHGLVVFFGGISSFFVVLFGILVFYDRVLRNSTPEMPEMIVGLVLFGAIYLICAIKAHIDDRYSYDSFD